MSPRATIALEGPVAAISRTLWSRGGSLGSELLEGIGSTLNRASSANSELVEIRRTPVAGVHGEFVHRAVQSNQR